MRLYSSYRLFCSQLLYGLKPRPIKNRHKSMKCLFFTLVFLFCVCYDWSGIVCFGFLPLNAYFRRSPHTNQYRYGHYHCTVNSAQLSQTKQSTLKCLSLYLTATHNFIYKTYSKSSLHNIIWEGQISCFWFSSRKDPGL